MSHPRHETPLSSALYGKVGDLKPTGTGDVAAPGETDPARDCCLEHMLVTGLPVRVKRFKFLVKDEFSGCKSLQRQRAKWDETSKFWIRLFFVLTAFEFLNYLVHLRSWSYLPAEAYSRFRSFVPVPDYDKMLLTPK